MKRFWLWLRTLVASNRHKLELALAAALVVIAAFPWNGVFEDWAFLLPVLAVALCALLVSAVCVAWRRPWWQALLIAAAVLILVVGEIAYHSDTFYGLPTPAMVASFFEGLAGAWSTVLSAGLPADPQGDVLVLPLVLAFVAAYASSELILRQTWIVGPVIPPLLSFGTALAFTSSERKSSLWTAVLLAAGVVGLVYRRANPPLPATATTASGRRRRFHLDVRTTGLLIAVLVLGVAAGWSVPVLLGNKPYALRDHYAAPIQFASEVSPLAVMQTQATVDKDQPLFRVTFGAIPAGVSVDRIPYAILESYDGTVWGTAAEFQPVGRRVPGASAEDHGAAVRQQYTLEGWNSSFAPALERAASVSGGAGNLNVDPGSGMLAISPSSPSRLSYGVVSDVVQHSSDELEAAKRSTDPALAPFVTKPSDVPQQFEQWVVTTIPKEGTDYERLQRLATTLHGGTFGYSTKALPGQSLGRLTQLVYKDQAAPAPAANQLGSSEQYAAAFALAARLVGYPTRVVVGYKVDPTTAAAGKEIVVRGGDVLAWPEVYLAGPGWVTFDPTSATPRDPGADTPATTAPPNLPKEVINSDLIDRGCKTACIPAAARPASSSSSLWTWLIIIPVVLLVAIVALLAARRVRRLRRKRGNAAARIMGAWKESSDRLTSYGLAPPRTTLTPYDITALLQETLPATAEALDELGALVDAALFDPTPPTNADADRSWAIEESIRRDARRHVSFGVRLRAMVDPRPLFSRSRRTAPKTAAELQPV
jgi:hypothetical protein